MKNAITIILIAIGVIIGAAFGKTVVQQYFGSTKGRSFETAIVEISKKMNATLPMQVDKDTRLGLHGRGTGPAADVPLHHCHRFSRRHRRGGT